MQYLAAIRLVKGNLSPTGQFLESQMRINWQMRLRNKMWFSGPEHHKMFIEKWEPKHSFLDFCLFYLIYSYLCHYYDMTLIKYLLLEIFEFLYNLCNQLVIVNLPYVYGLILILGAHWSHLVSIKIIWSAGSYPWRFWFN